MAESFLRLLLGMSEEPTSKWPVVRIDPAVKTRLEKLIGERLPRVPFLQVVNAILRAAVDQMDNAAPDPDSLMLLTRLHLIVSSKPSATDLAERVLENTQRLDAMERLLEKLGAAAEDHSVAKASSKKKQAARPKRAA